MVLNVLEIKQVDTNEALKQIKGRNIYHSSDKYENQTYTLGKQNQITKKERVFFEFYINQKPLWRIIDDFCSNKTPLIYNWTGFLGSSTPEINETYDKILFKLLKCQEVKICELELIFPDINEVESLKSKQTDYSQSNSRYVLIYGCRECVDYDHGGIGINVTENDNSYIWEIENRQGELKKYTFEKEEYLKILNEFNYS